MVKIDFTIYRGFDACPVWWRNFVIGTVKEPIIESGRHQLLADSIKRFDGTIVDAEPPGDVECLIFESEEAFKEFKFYWILYGE